MNAGCACALTPRHYVHLSEPILLCSLVHSEVDIKFSPADAQMDRVQGFGFMRDCWPKCHTLREINEFY